MILSKWNNSGSKFMEGNPKYHFYILLTSKVYKKDVTEKSLILLGFFAYFGNVFQADFQRCQKGFFPQNRIRTFTKHIFTIFREQFFKNCSLFYCQDLDRFSFIVKTSRSFFILQRR